MAADAMLSFEASWEMPKTQKNNGMCKVTNLYSHWLLLVLMVQEYNWDMQLKGKLLGAFFWGYLAGNLFAGAVSARLGAGMVLAFAAISWSALAIAMPMVADFGFGHTWLLLILLGLAASPLMPTTMQLLLAFLWLGFAMTKSREAGMEIARKMWEDALDNTGEVVVATGGTARADSFLPWWALKHPGFLALLAVHCSNNFAMYTIMSWGPSYFTEVLELPLESVGLYLMLPAAFSGIGAITGGVCTDWLQSRRCPALFGSLDDSIFCSAVEVCFGNLHSVPAASLAMIAAAMSIGILDTAQNAVYLDLAPQNAAAVVSLGNGIATLPGAAGPALVAVLLESTGLWICGGHREASPEVHASVKRGKSSGFVSKVNSTSAEVCCMGETMEPLGELLTLHFSTVLPVPFFGGNVQHWRADTMGRSCQVFGLPGDTTCLRAAAGGLQCKTGHGVPPESRQDLRSQQKRSEQDNCK
eukprot:s1289_g16.t1